mgnify:CR=1 FL=1
MIQRAIAAVRSMFVRGRMERDMDAELRYHLDRQIEENLRRGMTGEQARASARHTVGGLEQIKEECRQARAGRILDETTRDIRHGLRVLANNPGFTIIAALTLALGIGANTAIFSVVYGVLLRPLPYRDGGGLVVLHQQARQARLDNVPFSVKEIADYREASQTLEAVVEHHSMSFLLLGKDTAERVETAVVSANFFDVLGVKPMFGRTFVPSDEDHNADAVLILSHKYWQSRHGGDPSIVGRVFQMNNRPHTVIGVLPPIPQYPVESDVYMPTSQCPTRSSANFQANRNARMMTVFGRLKSGVPVEQAQSDLSVVAKRLEASYPESYPKANGYSISAIPLRNDLTRTAQPTLLVLLGAAGFVLLIACANVANLMLSRMLKVERELAVRLALGATKARIVRQLLTESMLLSLTGAALGLLMAPSTTSLLVKLAGRFTTRAAEVRMDAPVLIFTTLVALVTGLLFGLAPAISSTRKLTGGVNQQTGRSTPTVGRQRLRAALVIAQVAVSFLLLIGAGLMIRSFIKLQSVDPGFRPDHLLTMRITPNFTKYGSAQALAPVVEQILRRVKATGGVESAALVSNVPLSASGIALGPGSIAFEIEGRPVSKGELAPLVDTTVVSPDYFETIRQPLLRGRQFTEHDDPAGLAVAIINETMARHRWPAEDAIGRRVTFNGGRTWISIVGVVGDAKEYGLDRAVADELYLPLRQAGFANSLVVRTSTEPLSLAPLIRAVLHDIDPQIAVDRLNSLDRLHQDSVASPRVTTMLLSLFAGLALLISAGGIAAVMALGVSQRTQELGIRMALGASRASIVGMIVRNGLALGAAGVVLGMVAAVLLTRLLSTLLYSVSPTDAATFAAVSVLFVAVAVAACFVPARQATKLDPLVALRHE